MLDLGGVRVRFLVVGPTHTRGDTGFFVEGDGILFSGDVVMNQSFLAAGPASSVKAWLSAFDAFEQMRPRTIVPAHGPVGDGSIIAVNRAIMQSVQTRARQLKAEGRSADAAAMTVSGRAPVSNAPGLAAREWSACGGARAPSPKLALGDKQPG